MDKSIHSARHQRLAALLRQARLDAGLLQSDVAQQLDVNQTWVSKYETGERRLDLVQLQQVCKSLGLDLLELVASWQRGLR